MSRALTTRGATAYVVSPYACINGRIHIAPGKHAKALCYQKPPREGWWSWNGEEVARVKGLGGEFVRYSLCPACQKRATGGAP